MAKLTNPLTDEIPEDVKSLFRESSYDNMNGVRRDVTFIGGELKVPHGFGFKPEMDQLTVRVHLAYADTGAIWATREADDQNVYITSARPGRAIIEIAHPPKRK